MKQRNLALCLPTSFTSELESDHVRQNVIVARVVAQVTAVFLKAFDFFSLILLSYIHTLSNRDITRITKSLQHNQTNNPTQPTAAMDSGRKNLGDKMGDSKWPCCPHMLQPR